MVLDTLATHGVATKYAHLLIDLLCREAAL